MEITITLSEEDIERLPEITDRTIRSVRPDFDCKPINLSASDKGFWIRAWEITPGQWRVSITRVKGTPTPIRRFVTLADLVALGSGKDAV